MEQLYRGASSDVKMTMVVQTPQYQRTMQLTGQSLGKEYGFFRILSPRKDRGIATLKRDSEMWNYFPKINKVIKVPPSMMMGSWMGSDFTNDDLVKEARLEEDYTAEISFEGMREGQNIIEFSLVPKIDAAVVWGKLKLIILADSNIPLVEYYYDEDFELARTIWFSDIQLLAGRQRPAVLTVIPADKPEELTQFIYKHLSLNVELNDSLFSLSSLKKR